MNGDEQNHFSKKNKNTFSSVSFIDDCIMFINIKEIVSLMRTFIWGCSLFDTLDNWSLCKKMWTKFRWFFVICIFGLCFLLITTDICKLNFVENKHSSLKIFPLSEPGNFSFFNFHCCKRITVLSFLFS